MGRCHPVRLHHVVCDRHRRTNARAGRGARAPDGDAHRRGGWQGRGRPRTDRNIQPFNARHSGTQAACAVRHTHWRLLPQFR
eukprot:5926732-Prymnesium_polylepis.1